MCPVKSEADVDEKLTHMRPVVVLETLNLARYVVYCTSKLKPEFDKASVPLCEIFLQNLSILLLISQVTEVVALSAAGWAWSLHRIFRAGRGWLGVVDTHFGVSQPAADAER